MNERQVLDAFGALSQQTRLQVIRKLVVAGPGGLAAGMIAEAVNVSPSNISFHLKELEHAGLISAQRESRSIVYSANFETLNGLAHFLMENCCSGQFDAGCGPTELAGSGS
ncbi:metalloregulator ArsR/SmtB family transcription factor [uncultured Rhizobium sp.]|uniref:ArsR/SmtB family transcription factor n=1 Tax=unclassified Neorhizobium TaxID=2629175 RepID=UPI002D7FF865|nr:metalloregulator ArsR/SmtB family transcription factor [uncultured Rhizobium sp.]